MTSKMKNDLKNEDDLKDEDNLKNEDDLKNEADLKDEDDLKNEDDHQNEDDLQNWPSLLNYFVPLPKKLPEIFLMTSHLDSHTTTDIKPDMLSGVQTGNGISHDRYDIRGIAHACANR